MYCRRQCRRGLVVHNADFGGAGYRCEEMAGSKWLAIHTDHHVPRIPTPNHLTHLLRRLSPQLPCLQLRLFSADELLRRGEATDLAPLPISVRDFRVVAR
jgi:hypothetical protein